MIPYMLNNVYVKGGKGLGKCFDVIEVKPIISKMRSMLLIIILLEKEAGR